MKICICFLNNIFIVRYSGHLIGNEAISMYKIHVLFVQAIPLQ